MNVEKAEQSTMNMGEHIGRRHQLPGIAPAIVDGEESAFLLDPGHEGQMIRIGIARDMAAQGGEAEAARFTCRDAHHRGSLPSAETGTGSMPSTAFSRSWPSTGSWLAGETGSTR